jgi:hypothetical protein
MATDKLSTQTQITILAALDSSNNVQLFLANDVAALDSSDKVKDGFSGSTKDANVTVTVMSTSGAVSVSSSSNPGTWNNNLSVSSGAVTLYYAQATYDMPSKGDKETDTFTITVGGYTADPTIVISRGGTGNNIVIGPRPKQG